MQQGGSGRELDPVDGRKIVPFDFRFRGLQRPWHVVDFSPQQLAGPVRREQAITLGKKVLDRPRAALVNGVHFA
jgi:hypothetical protein